MIAEIMLFSSGYMKVGVLVMVAIDNARQRWGTTTHEGSLCSGG